MTPGQVGCDLLAVLLEAGGFVPRLGEPLGVELEREDVLVVPAREIGKVFGVGNTS